MRGNSITWRANFMTSLSLHVSSWWRHTFTTIKLSEQSHISRKCGKKFIVWWSKYADKLIRLFQIAHESKIDKRCVLSTEYFNSGWPWSGKLDFSSRSGKSRNFANSQGNFKYQESEGKSGNFIILASRYLGYIRYVVHSKCLKM